MFLGCSSARTQTSATIPDHLALYCCHLAQNQCLHSRLFGQRTWPDDGVRHPSSRTLSSPVTSMLRFPQLVVQSPTAGGSDSRLIPGRLGRVTPAELTRTNRGNVVPPYALIDSTCKAKPPGENFGFSSRHIFKLIASAGKSRCCQLELNLLCFARNTGINAAKGI